MKLDTQSRTIERSQPFKEQQFKIAATAHAFEILSSRLYTDIILAIVRELSTNAADAHIESGNEKTPFDVHLPNSIEPHFSIRDYGTGLSQESVEHVYTTYFSSTRNSSNEFTGALGLGSKSPFAYTDMFTVTSYYNGTVYTYSAFKNESGEPSIALMNKVVTDQPNGLAIGINTKPGDEREFAQKAARVYRFFKVRPNITGARIEIPQPSPLMSSDGWELYDGNAHADGQISVVMGNVCYAASNSDKVRHKLGYGGQLILYVPIGECGIAANREELQYDASTIYNLQKRINQAQVEARKQMVDAISHCTTLLERLIALKTYSNVLDLPQQDKVIPKHKEGVYTLRKVDLRRDNKLLIGYDRFDSELRPGSGSKYIFVELDVDNPNEIRQKLKNNLRAWIKQQGQGIFYLASIADRAEFEKTFGKPAMKLSEIPDAPRQHNGGGHSNVNHTFIKRMGRLSEQWHNVVLNDGDILDTKDAIAIPRKGYNVLWNGQEEGPNIIIQIASSLGYTTIYGLPSNRYNKMRKELGLKDLQAEAKTAMEKFVKDADEFTRAAFHYHDSSHKHEYDPTFWKKIKGLSTTCSNVATFMSIEDIPYVWRQLLNEYKLKLPDAENFLETFKKRYPLIASINMRYFDLNDVIEYIKLKEKT